MRYLIYVPVIHTSADLGSMGEDVASRGIADLGEDIWKKHRKTVDGFWDAILRYFDSLDVTGMKLYQDGMITDGEVGQKIVDETARAGSINYELVAKLIKKGAVLIKTEDFNLVKEERDSLLSIMGAKTVRQKLTALAKYKYSKNRLLDKRDKFIAEQISRTLNDKEKGIIFIGAYHNVRKMLPEDIQIMEIKDADKVKEYQALLPFNKKKKERFEELGGYLIKEINKAMIH